MGVIKYTMCDSFWRGEKMKKNIWKSYGQIFPKILGKYTYVSKRLDNMQKKKNTKNPPKKQKKQNPVLGTS